MPREPGGARALFMIGASRRPSCAASAQAPHRPRSASLHDQRLRLVRPARPPSWRGSAPMSSPLSRSDTTRSARSPRSPRARHRPPAISAVEPITFVISSTRAPARRLVQHRGLFGRPRALSPAPDPARRGVVDTAAWLRRVPSVRRERQYASVTIRRSVCQRRRTNARPVDAPDAPACRPANASLTAPACMSIDLIAPGPSTQTRR